MPVISEADEDNILAHQDFSQLLDLPETIFAGSNEDVVGSAVAAEALEPTCPTHQDSNEYDSSTNDWRRLLTWPSLSRLCHGFMGDWNLPEQSADPYLDVAEPDYTIFENVSSEPIHVIHESNVLINRSSYQDSPDLRSLVTIVVSDGSTVILPVERRLVHRATFCFGNAV